MNVNFRAHKRCQTVQEIETKYFQGYDKDMLSQTALIATLWRGLEGIQSQFNSISQPITTYFLVESTCMCQL